MPIHTEIYINGRHIKTLNIGRAEGDTYPESNNRYVATWGDWTDDNAVQFDHVYGDGLEICVMKGIEAMVDMEEHVTEL